MRNHQNREEQEQRMPLQRGALTACCRYFQDPTRSPLLKAQELAVPRNAYKQQRAERNQVGVSASGPEITLATSALTSLAAFKKVFSEAVVFTYDMANLDCNKRPSTPARFSILLHLEQY